MRLLCVHGWGWDKNLWRPMLDALPPRMRKDALCLDLGFFGDKQCTLPSHTNNVMAVGHSLGFLWLLLQGKMFSSFVSIAGFTHFARDQDMPHAVPMDILAAMKKDFFAHPQDFLHHFYASMDAPHPPPDSLDVERLAQGFDILGAGDGRAFFAQLDNRDIPVLSLAGRKDMIVRPAHHRDCFAGYSCVSSLWFEDGGHLLPLTHAKSCATMLRDFAEQIS